MGSPSDELDRSANEGPLTQVTLTKGFWISKHEVTQGEYLRVMGVNPSFYANNTNRPVEYVTWFDATNYCAKLTQAERSAGRLPANLAYRLPTEAEWECAARAGSQTRFCYGDDLTYTNLGQYAWLPWVDAGADIDGPVATKQPNAWGLYDMHGNVWEWCQDYYSDSLPGGSIVDPQGPPTGTIRVFRGGSFGQVLAAYRSASRWGDLQTQSNRSIGFRVVLAPTN
jgi:formylglycine-generating enzyme required for sulfatase activity